MGIMPSAGKARTNRDQNSEKKHLGWSDKIHGNKEKMRMKGIQIRIERGLRVCARKVIRRERPHVKSREVIRNHSHQYLIWSLVLGCRFGCHHRQWLIYTSILSVIYCASWTWASESDRQSCSKQPLYLVVRGK